MRGMPSGFGQEPVVQMWPQRWNASLFSGRIAAATAPPPVSARMAPPIRPRNDLLVKPDARRVERLRAAPSTTSSGRRMLDPLRSHRDELLELLERVHRSFGRDRAADEMHREGRPGNVPALERIGLLVLVDDPDGDAFARQRPHARRHLAAKATTWAEERDELRPGADEPG